LLSNGLKPANSLNTPFVFGSVNVTKKIQISTTVNGEPRDFLCEARHSLLEVLRDQLSLTGAKEGCNNGNCGSCTVKMNGVPVLACCVLGVEAQDAEIETVEGMAQHGHMHPLQQCFLEGAALQCGICTPGFLVSAKTLLEKKPHATEEEIRFDLSNNLCRCTGYDKIIRSVLEAQKILNEKQSETPVPA
jgi:carbon-monoxide dehydrogenase small subunit